ASIDREHDEADRGRLIDCPVLVLWGARGAREFLYGDVLEVLPPTRPAGFARPSASAASRLPSPPGKRSRTPWPGRRRSSRTRSRGRQGARHDLLRLGQDPLKVLLALDRKSVV